MPDSLQPQNDSNDGPQGLRLGTVLEGTYRVVERLGGGGMAEVFVASHTRLAGRFAIKALNRELARNKEALVRFGREAAVLSSLHHPNVVQVFDFNVTDDGTPYLVMELLDGKDLRRVLDETPQLPPDRIARIVRQIASGLAAAHDRGVIHRDLKPANVVLVPLRGQPDFVKVLDFGISKVMWSVKLTMQSAIMGTPEYMAPEQAEGKLEAIDHLTDQFALAAMTYALLAGRDPFRGDTPLAVLYQVVNGEPEPLQNFVTWPADQVDAVLRRALSKRQSDRFTDVLTFAEALDQAVNAPTTTVAVPASVAGAVDLAPPSPSDLPRAVRFRQLGRLSAIGAAAGAAGVALGLASALPAWGQLRHAAADTASHLVTNLSFDRLLPASDALALPTVRAALPMAERTARVGSPSLRPCGVGAVVPADRARQDRCVTSAGLPDHEPLLAFWLGDPARPWSERTARWFTRDDALDQTCSQRFGADVDRAGRGELDGWRADARGTLALVVLLDQLSRNVHRGTPQAFANDPRGLAVSLEAQDRGFDQALAPMERALLYMPMMHAEDRAVQARSVAAFTRLLSSVPQDAAERATLQTQQKFALRHQEVIERFGRFPHRNAILGRASTPEEQAFLSRPGSTF